MKERYAFIDWMKAIGMILIVYGHLFPKGNMTAFLYTFNVPLFFAISGYLTKEESNKKLLFKKITKGLIIPYLLLSIIKNVPFYLSHFSFSNILNSFGYILMGVHGNDMINGCGNLWFVYALIINKLVFSYTGRYRVYIVLPCMVFTLFFKQHPFISYSCAIINSALSYPIFVFGNWLRNIFTTKRGYTHKTFSPPYSLGIALGAYVCVWWLSKYNGVALLYLGGYGNSYVLFVVGSVLGIAATYLLSIAITPRNKISPMIQTISSGTIIILAFQMPITRYISKLPFIMEANTISNNIILLVGAIVITLSFYPIIIFFQKYLPWAVGRK